MAKQGDRPTLQQLRRAKRLTQRTMADAIGVTSKAVSEWERGIKEPHLSPMQMLKLMQLYGCNTLEEFVDAVAASVENP